MSLNIPMTPKQFAGPPCFLTLRKCRTGRKHRMLRSNFLDFCGQQLGVLNSHIPWVPALSRYVVTRLSGLEGSQRRRDHQAGHLQSPARIHCPVPQRRQAHPRSPAHHFGGPFAGGLYLPAHFGTDPARRIQYGLHHRPHRQAVPGWIRRTIYEKQGHGVVKLHGLDNSRPVIYNILRP